MLIHAPSHPAKKSIIWCHLTLPCHIGIDMTVSSISVRIRGISPASCYGFAQCNTAVRGPCINTRNLPLSEFQMCDKWPQQTYYMTLEVSAVIKIQNVIGSILVLPSLISGYLYFQRSLPSSAQLQKFPDQLRNYQLFKKDPVTGDRNM
jgi:hypothetical protein